MLAFPSMIVPAAEKAGIKLPDNPDDLEGYNPEEYIHWHAFTLMQLGASMPYPSVHFDNAEVIAKISEEDLKNFTYQDLIDAGFQIGYSKPLSYP